MKSFQVLILFCNMVAGLIAVNVGTKDIQIQNLTTFAQVVLIIVGILVVVANMYLMFSMAIGKRHSSQLLEGK